jgi:hypothetical protein
VKNIAAKSSNLVKNPKNGGTPANEKKITIIVVEKKVFPLKNLYSFKDLNILKSKIKKIVKKNDNNKT